jgi:hemerythrin
MAYIEWQPEYSVGVKLIDDQHKHFMDTLNKLYSTIQNNEVESLNKIISELVSYTKTHFSTEEKYFKKFHYEEAAIHIAEHKRLIAKVDEFVKRKKENPLTVSFELLDFLENWLVGHLAMMDKRYTKCFNDNGLF